MKNRDFSPKIAKIRGTSLIYLYVFVYTKCVYADFMLAARAKIDMRGKNIAVL